MFSLSLFLGILNHLSVKVSVTFTDAPTSFSPSALLPEHITFLLPGREKLFHVSKVHITCQILFSFINTKLKLKLFF